MALMVVVLSGQPDDIAIRRETAERLSHLGISTATVVGNAETTAVVGEGGGLAPGRGATDVAEIVGQGRPCQVLHPLLQMAVSAGLDRGRT